MADFKLRAPPRLRMAAGFQIDGAFGLTDVPVQLAGSAIARAQSTAALLRGVNLGGAAAASAQATAALIKGIRLGSAAVAGASGSASLNWSLPSITLTVGASGLPAGQYNIAATLPGGYAPGGVFSVDPAATQLQSGVSFTEAGLIDVGSAATSVAAGVVFTYHEPGALSTLTLHPTLTATLPYMGTVYPPEGIVPAGRTLVSPDDGNLRGSVIATWPDGSASIVVVAGEKAVTSGVTVPLRLRVGTPAGTALTVARIKAIVTNIKVNGFGGAEQTLTLSSATEDRIWWANESTICARYRLSVGVSALEAVIDIHAFRAGVSDRAFVEVVIENSRMSVSSPSKPAAAAYTSASVTVNDGGVTLASGVSSSASGINGTHEAFRAWYCSGWVGGDPGIEVTHDTLSMQSHPALFKIEKASTVDLATTYGSDVYTPFGFGRHRSGDMGGGGDHDTLSPLPMWEARYLQSGSKYARRAVLASALSMLTFNINNRDTGTNLVPTHAQLAAKSFALGFPNQGGYDGGSSGVWEPAHQPAGGLMAFLCRPSPCFIEISQKIAAFNSLTQSPGNQVFGYWFETRGKAWAWRNLVQSAFVTPDALPFKASAKSNMVTNVTYLQSFDNSPEDKLNFVWDKTTAEHDDGDPYYTDHSGGGIADGIPFQFAIWEHHWLAAELYKGYACKLLTGSDQINLGALVDWALLQPVRWVNEQANGGWRYIGYRTTCGTADGSNNVGMGQLSNWGAMRAHRNPTNPPTVSGSWYTQGSNDPATYASGWIVENGDSGYIYVGPYFSALAAAVERGVSGADAAWDTVMTNVTNMAAFRDWAATDPRNAWFPRNK